MCYEGIRRRIDGMPCFTEDEGRPLGVGVQAQTSNRRKLRRLRGCVVNVLRDNPRSRAIALIDSP